MKLRPRKRDRDCWDHFSKRYFCPMCGAALASYDYGRAWCPNGLRENQLIDCPKCGQEIDWSAEPRAKGDDEIKVVQQLGSILGWGHMISLCTALWRRDLATKYGDGCKSAAFIGVCACSIKEDVLPSIMRDVALYDGIVAKALDKEAGK